ncbi:MAG: CDP-alcohol phosphatidyltransferase family protein [Thermoanaerobaculia bacterium]
MADLRSRAGALLEPLGRAIPLSPNAITLVALACNLAAAVALALAPQARILWLVAIALAGVGGLLDILDGVVARARNQMSRWGDFLDHFCDRVSDLSLMAGWILGAAVHPMIGIPTLAAVMLNGYVGTQVEATFRTREYETVGRGQYYAAMLGLPMLAWWLGERLTAAPMAGPLSGADLLTAGVGAAAIFGTLQRVRVARRVAASQESGKDSRPVE